jgi:hypothetical protein
VKNVKMEPGGPKRGEFCALTMACKGILKANARFDGLEPGGMHSLQSMDGSVLRLHSCRALSPEPQSNVAHFPTTQKLAFGLFNRFEQAIECSKPKGQLCNWKLRPF